MSESAWTHRLVLPVAVIGIFTALGVIDGLRDMNVVARSPELRVEGIVESTRWFNITRNGYDTLAFKLSGVPAEFELRPRLWRESRVGTSALVPGAKVSVTVWATEIEDDAPLQVASLIVEDREIVTVDDWVRGTRKAVTFNIVVSLACLAFLGWKLWRGLGGGSRPPRAADQ